MSRHADRELQRLKRKAAAGKLPPDKFRRMLELKRTLRDQPFDAMPKTKRKTLRPP